MNDSRFSFIENHILRGSLDETFDHIIELLSLIEDNKYNKSAKSSFRKTGLIHTAAIIEALLFYIMDQQFTNDDISDFYGEWKLKNKKTIYKINENHKIISGEYKKEKSKTKKEKMNLGQIANFLKDKKIIDKKLFSEINTIRLLRNDQHLGTHKNIKTYTKENLEKSFSIASKVSDLAFECK